MSNLRVTIIRQCKTTPTRWKRYPAALENNGKPKPDGAVWVKKLNQEMNYPVGYYQIRWYDGRKTTYKTVGEDPTKALAEWRRQKKLLQSAAESDTASGVVTSKPPKVPAGAVTLRLPQSLLKSCKVIAQQERTTLEEWLLTVVAREVGHLSAHAKTKTRAKGKRKPPLAPNPNGSHDGK
jgi:hypothetical protein